MSASSPSSGYIDELLRLLGVGPSAAQHTQDLLLRPTTVILIALTTWLVARFGSRLIRRGLGRYSKRVEAAGDDSQALRVDTVARIVANLWRVVAWIIGVITMISVTGINLTPLLAGAPVIGATIGFGAQSLVRNFLSG